ncbi:hypothetical protein JTB14_028624 [Gonioctena quinquepunctata]|nr:hypothetical protein JTB14_028624 [Gonioctena quinquepunctata]
MNRIGNQDVRGILRTRIEVMSSGILGIRLNQRKTAKGLGKLSTGRSSRDGESSRFAIGNRPEVGVGRDNVNYPVLRNMGTECSQIQRQANEEKFSGICENLANNFLRNEIRKEENLCRGMVDDGNERLISLKGLEVQGRKLPRIPITIDGKSVLALLDTGASLNFVRPDVLENMDLTGLPNPNVVQLGCQTSTSQSLGQVECTITIEGRDYEMTVSVVAGLSENMILGMPFLVMTEAILDVNRKCLYFGVASRQTLFWDQSVQRRLDNLDMPEFLEGQFSEDTRLDLMEVISKFPDVFTEAIRQPITKALLHEIIVEEERPFRQFRYGKLSEERKRLVHEEIQRLLEAGVIVPSMSEYCSPVVLTPKKDGKLRFCVDYQKINKLIIPEALNLPLIQELVRELGKAKVFSTPDLRNGFWQAPLSEDSRKYTAFGGSDGTVYVFVVSSFGLKNGPAAFQKLMASVLSGYTDNFYKVYLDDIMIYSDSLEEHCSHLRRVLERLRSHGLWLSPAKCDFGLAELNYLGRVIFQRGNRPQEEHVRNTVNFTVPRSVKQLRGFLEPHELARPDFSRNFCVQTDASHVGIGEVLFQEREDRERDVIAYASSKLNPTERNYPVNGCGMGDDMRKAPEPRSGQAHLDPRPEPLPGEYENDDMG